MFILIVLLVAVAISFIPFTCAYFSIFNVMLNEMVKGLFVRNKRQGNIDDQEGILKRALTVYACITAESVAALALFYVMNHFGYRTVLFVFFGMIAVGVIRWFRFPVRLIWLLSVGALITVPIYFQVGWAMIVVSVFLTSMFLIKSVRNGVFAFKGSFMGRNIQSGNGIVARMKTIPSVLVGTMLLLQSISIGFIVLITILRTLTMN